jgi:hypothetical protein
VESWILCDFDFLFQFYCGGVPRGVPPPNDGNYVLVEVGVGWGGVGVGVGWRWGGVGVGWGGV